MKDDPDARASFRIGLLITRGVNFAIVKEHCVEVEEEVWQGTERHVTGEVGLTLGVILREAIYPRQ